MTTIEWLDSDQNVLMMNLSEPHLTLVIDRVTESHHNTEYTCRVTSPFGNQTKSTALHVAQHSSTDSPATIGGAVMAVLLILLLTVIGFVSTIFVIRRYVHSAVYLKS